MPFVLEDFELRDPPANKETSSEYSKSLASATLRLIGGVSYSNNQIQVPDDNEESEDVTRSVVQSWEVFTDLRSPSDLRAQGLEIVLNSRVSLLNEMPVAALYYAVDKEKPKLIEVDPFNFEGVDLPKAYKRFTNPAQIVAANAITRFLITRQKSRED